MTYFEKWLEEQRRNNENNWYKVYELNDTVKIAKGQDIKSGNILFNTCETEYDRALIVAKNQGYIK